MADSYNGVSVPKDGARITYSNGKYNVPDNPIIPFIEGDGTGRDIWKASVRVFDAAVEKAYKGKRKVAWYEVFAGEYFVPCDFALAFVGLLYGRVEHAHRGLPDVASGAVAFNEGNNGIVRNLIFSAAIFDGRA